MLSTASSCYTIRKHGQLIYIHVKPRCRFRQKHSSRFDERGHSMSTRFFIAVHFDRKNRISRRILKFLDKALSRGSIFN